MTDDIRDDDPRLAAFRTPPHNVEAEKCVLGAIFANNRVYEAVADILAPADFALAQNGKIFKTCGKMIAAGRIADPVTMMGVFKSDGSLVEIGGAQYLAELAGSAVGAINAGEYARLVADLSGKRKLIEIATELMERAYGPDESEIIREEAEQKLFELSRPAGTGPQWIGECVDGVIRGAEAALKAGGVSGLATGFVDLDALLGGLRGSQLIILAGRPAMGKTGLAQNIASHIADFMPTLFFSLEMSRDELAARELAGQTGITSQSMRTGRADIGTLVDAGNMMRDRRLLIDDRAALSVTQIRNTTRRNIRKHEIGFVVIDYLQLMRERAESKVVEIGEISRGLKAIAKEFDIPVLAVSQLSRKVEERPDKRPILSDLRESGAIEQDADIVLFVYREEYYLREPERGDRSEKTYAAKLIEYQTRKQQCGGIAQVIVAKNRHGPCGVVELRFEAEKVRFYNLARI